jgi:hypothetical protein
VRKAVVQSLSQEVSLMKIFVTDTTNQSNCDTCIIAAQKVKNFHTSKKTKDDKKAGNYESRDADNENMLPAGRHASMV